MNSDLKIFDAVGVDSTTLIAALMVFADSLERFGDFEKIKNGTTEEKKNWLWNARNTLVAHPFYMGIFQSLAQHDGIKKKFPNEFSYLHHQLKVAETMLANPNIQAILTETNGNLH